MMIVFRLPVTRFRATSSSDVPVIRADHGGDGAAVRADGVAEYAPAWTSWARPPVTRTRQVAGLGEPAADLRPTGYLTK